MIGGGGGGSSTGASGALQYSNGSGAFLANNNIVVDGTNGRVGIGTTTPGATLEVISNATASPGLTLKAIAAQTASLLQINNSSGSSVAGISPSGRFLAGSGAVGAPGLTFQGDSATGLYLPATSTLALSTAGAERLRVDATGNVGIGTTSPGYALEVIGSTRSQYFMSSFVGNASSPAFRISNGAGLGFFSAGSGDLGVTTNGNERMRVDTSGNVGIGTTSPTATLHLKAGGTAASSAPFKFTSSAGSLLTTKEDGAMEYDGTNYYLTVGSTRTAIPLSGGTGTFSVVDGAAGTVGAPSLSFTGDTNTGLYDAAVGTLGVAAGGVQVMNFTSTGANVAAGENFSMTSGSGKFSQTYTGTGPAAAITDTVAASGDILDLATISTVAVNNDKALSIAVSGANGTGGVTRYGAYSSVTATGATSTNVGGYFSASGASNNYGLIVGSGNVGIGTAAPSYLLHLVGTTGQNRIEQDSTTGASTHVLSSNGGSSYITLQVSGAGSTATSNGAFLGMVNFNSFDGTVFNSSSILRGEADGASSAGSTPGRLTFLTTPTGSTTGLERMRITQSGNVGIGTTSPGHPLEISGAYTGVNRDVISIVNSDTSVFQGAAVLLLSNDMYARASTYGSGYANPAYSSTAFFQGGNGTSGAVGLMAYDAGGYLKFLTGGNSTTNERMRITANGNVGIGTTSPANGSKLDIEGTGGIILNAGNVGIGGWPYGGAGQLLSLTGTDVSSMESIVNTNSTAARWPGLNITNYMGSAGTGAPSLFLYNARGTQGSPAAVQSGDHLGELEMGGHDGTALFNSVFILAMPTQNWTSSAHGTALNFRTTANGSSSPLIAMTIDQSGSVGIGTTNPTATLDVLATSTVISGIVYGNKLSESFLPTAASSANAAGAFFSATTGNAVNMTGIVRGSENKVWNNNTATVTEAEGSYNWVQNANSGTITSAYGTRSEVQNQGAGTITAAAALYTSISKPAGTITNSYGIYLDTQAGTNKWGVFQNDPTANNYFSGNVGIGTTSPGASLDVHGHIANSGTTATMGSCGTSPSITGNDTRGVVTTGSTAISTCVINFASAFTSTPICVATWNGTPSATNIGVTPATGSLTVNFSATVTSGVFSYYCSQ